MPADRLRRLPGALEFDARIDVRSQLVAGADAQQHLVAVVLTAQETVVQTAHTHATEYFPVLSDRHAADERERSAGQRFDLWNDIERAVRVRYYDAGRAVAQAAVSDFHGDIGIEAVAAECAQAGVVRRVLEEGLAAIHTHVEARIGLFGGLCAGTCGQQRQESCGNCFDHH